MNNISEKLSFFSSLSLERTANLFRGCLKDRIFYLHIPKCGGTSINKALQACYHKWTLGDTANFFSLNHPASWETAQVLNDLTLPPDTVDDQAVMNLREELLIYYMSQEHIAYIGGHFRFSERAYKSFGDRYSYLTILRNPVKRWLSSYLFNRYRNPEQYRRLDMDFEEYVESDFGKSQGYEYAKFLGCPAEKGDFMTSEVVDTAKENLHRFRIVGFLEDMEAFESEFSQHFGRRLSISYLNQRPKNDKVQVDITESMKKKIEEICEPDLEVYNYAVKNFAPSNIRDRLLRHN